MDLIKVRPENVQVIDGCQTPHEYPSLSPPGRKIIPRPKSPNTCLHQQGEVPNNSKTLRQGGPNKSIKAPDVAPLATNVPCEHVVPSNLIQNRSPREKSLPSIITQNITVVVNQQSLHTFSKTEPVIQIPEQVVDLEVAALNHYPRGTLKEVDRLAVGVRSQTLRLGRGYGDGHSRASVMKERIETKNRSMEVLRRTLKLDRQTARRLYIKKQKLENMLADLQKKYRQTNSVSADGLESPVSSVDSSEINHPEWTAEVERSLERCDESTPIQPEDSPGTHAAHRYVQKLKRPKVVTVVMSPQLSSGPRKTLTIAQRSKGTQADKACVIATAIIPACSDSAENPPVEQVIAAAVVPVQF